jgi:hypothetical protein
MRRRKASSDSFIFGRRLSGAALKRGPVSPCLGGHATPSLLRQVPLQRARTSLIVSIMRFSRFRSRLRSVRHRISPHHCLDMSEAFVGGALVDISPNFPGQMIAQQSDNHPWSQEVVGLRLDLVGDHARLYEKRTCPQGPLLMTHPSLRRRAYLLASAALRRCTVPTPTPTVRAVLPMPTPAARDDRIAVSRPPAPPSDVQSPLSASQRCCDVFCRRLVPPSPDPYQPSHWIVLRSESASTPIRRNMAVVVSMESRDATVASQDKFGSVSSNARTRTWRSRYMRCTCG